LAQRLLDHGFKNVHPLYGGFDAWQEAGYPIEPKEERSTMDAGEP